MKVLFLKLVPNVWHAWEIKEVNDSYARNFLIPKGFARKLDINEEKKLLEEEKKKEEARRNLIENRHKIKEILDCKNLVFKANTLNNWKMFWSIWENEIIKKIFEEFGIKLEKKHIEMPNWHIKRIWKNDIFVKLSPDTVAKITVIVE